MKFLFNLILWVGILWGGLKIVEKNYKRPIKTVREEFVIQNSSLEEIIAKPGKVSATQFEKLLKKNQDFKKQLNKKRVSH